MFTLVNPIVISGAHASVGVGASPSHGHAGGERTEGKLPRPTRAMGLDLIIGTRQLCKYRVEYRESPLPAHLKFRVP